MWLREDWLPDSYDAKELTQIYILELERMGWIIEHTSELEDIIRENYNHFKSFGRDMNTLAMQTKNVMSRLLYDKIVRGEKTDNRVSSINVVKEAIEIFKQNLITVERTGRPNQGRDIFSQLFNVNN